MMKCDISVIMPVFREEKLIDQAVSALQRLDRDRRLEIIVVDGDPEERTVKAVKSDRIVTTRSAKGRGRQMNAGALLASGNILLFLHADTQLPQDGLMRVRAVLQDSRCMGGSFDLGIRSDRFCFRLIEKAASLRSRITRVPYGDQAIFLRKDFFLRLGGFSDLPLMEDVDLMRRVRKSGARIQIIKEKVGTSARRWEKEGVLACTLRNWMLVLLYLVGVSPDRLARYYKDHSRTGKD